MDYSDGISTLPFILSFGEAHPGQNFSSIDEAHFNFNFFKVRLNVEYLEKITPASYVFTFVTTPGEDLIAHNSSIIPASFTIKTSRTDPLEPQPVAA